MSRLVSDRTVGRTSLVLVSVLYAYYSLWTLLTPLVPAPSPIHAYFPATREPAVRIAAALVLVPLAVVGVVTGFILVETANRNRARRQASALSERRDKDE
ncbi:hypothetical protein JCM11491_001956 [Sporobolomyces phaffii]